VSGLAPDARTAVVTLTHDPKLDVSGADPRRSQLRRSTSAAWARRRPTRRGRTRLAERGVVAAASIACAAAGRRTARDAGRRSAVSILAEIVAALRGSREGGMRFGAVGCATPSAPCSLIAARRRSRVEEGAVLSAADVEALAVSGHGEVVCARLDPGELAEDAAALRIATALSWRR